MSKRSSVQPKRQPEPVAPPPNSTTLPLLASLGLIVAILAIYGQTFGYDYVAYDDDQYVYENAMITQGLSSATIKWAFTTFYYANWHPLTWISYLLDFQLFGMSPGASHAVNVLLHTASTLLLFLALIHMTRQPWRSLIVSGIFALHPLHVESVAWISERKDVLSTFFMMLMLLLYVRYAQAPSLAKYVPVALAFALSLMAKPMAVTWPFVLLLLDFWPLRRLSEKPWRLLLEKAPLLLLTAIASVLTFMAQSNYGAVATLERLPLTTRLANAAVAYVAYIVKGIWPRDLAVFYPAHPHSAGTVLLSLVVLIAVTILAFLCAHTRPFLLVGWLWYLGMLVPVIGIVQVGAQAMADRYSYVPFVGLSIALVWTTASFLDTRPAMQRYAFALSMAALLIFGVVAFQTTRYWSDSKTLFEHALAVTKGNYIIMNNLGVVLGREGRSKEAVALYREALAANPDYADGRANLGHELLKAGKMQDAETELTQAVRLSPSLSVALADLGLTEAAAGKLDQSAQHLESALRLAPANAETQNNLCYVLQRQQRLDEAIRHCQQALELKPDYSSARFNLGTALIGQGKTSDAARELNLVLKENPNDAAARAALASIAK